VRREVNGRKENSAARRMKSGEITAEQSDGKELTDGDGFRNTIKLFLDPWVYQNYGNYLRKTNLAHKR
jgi:hypothetical protein